MTDRSHPLVSIGISTYNRADGYLKDALGSAVRQSYPNLEIIVSDNCSADGTPALVEGFGDPRIRFYRQERNIGANNNFNFCAEQARGSYFLLLHDDDLIDPDFVAVCMDAARYQTGVGVIRTGTRKIDADGAVIGETPNGSAGLSTPEFFLSWFAGETAFYLCSTLYNTRGLREVGGFRSRKNLFDDVVPLVRLAARHGRVDVNEVKASFRRHDSNLGAAAAVDDWCRDSVYVLEVMCEEAPEAAKAIRKAGLRYFSEKNYGYASAIASPTERLATYLRVYRRFDYAYSPLRNFFPKAVRRSVRRLGRVGTRVLGRA